MIDYIGLFPEILWLSPNPRNSIPSDGLTTGGSGTTCAPTHMALAGGTIFSDFRPNPDDVVHRVCPGLYLANRSLYINIALLLWSFRIVEQPDAPIDMTAYSDTVVSHAAPFDVEFIPRIEAGQLKVMMSESMI